MPPSLPHVSGAEVVRALQKLGFIVLRQKGSHVVMRREMFGCVIPQNRELKIGTLSGLLKQAGVTSGEFMEAL